MANTVRIKRSTGSSAPTTLANAELAHAEGSDIVFIGKGTGGAGGSATTIEKIGGKGAFFDKDTVRTTNHVLAGAASGSASAPTFRALVSDDIPSIAHTKISDFDAGVRTNRLDQLTVPSASVSLNSQTITNLADPVNTQDAATKGFVEATSQGLDVKDSVKVATTGNITISTALNSGDTIDGITLADNDRVLVKDQDTSSQNGIYIVSSSPSRSDDLATGADAAGMFTFVEQGTVNADNGFVCTSNKGSAVVGTNNLTFAQFSGAGQITAGDGLDKSGNTLAVDLKANGGLVIESTEIAVDLGASSITGTLAVSDGGTGSTSASGARTNLGVAIGSDVQAFDQQLSDIAGLTPTDSNFIVGNGSNFILESGATARASLGLTIGTDVEPHSDKLTELATMAQTTADSLADLTATEVEILDGATLTTTELNFVDGVTSAIQTQLDNKQPLDTELTELATMSSGTASALADLTGTEVAILDGATVTTSELNILDGATVTVGELNILDGATLTTSELNILDGATVTASELNILDGATLSTSELNILDGVTATATEINATSDGNTSATSTTLVTADRIVVNDNGTMKQVALSDLVTFLEDESTSGFDIDGGSYS